MKKLKNGILIGKVAARTGVTVSVTRFYDMARLVAGGRYAAGPCDLMGDKFKR